MIIQTNIWMCENKECCVVEATSAVVAPYDDPVIGPPRDGWDFGRLSVGGEEKLLCPSCFRKAIKEIS